MAESNRVENAGEIHDYQAFFAAVKRGDWDEMNEFLTLHPNAITAKNSFSLETALHNATIHGHEQIVEKLVQLMTEEELEQKDVQGRTALAYAAKDNIKMVECMVTKNKKLLGIAEDTSGMTPILIAAKLYRWDIVRYLYSFTPLEDLMPDKGPYGSELVSQCLHAKQLDIAWELLERCPSLVCTKGLTGYPVSKFALLPSAFPSGTLLKFYQWWIYKRIHVEYAPSINEVRMNVQNQENEQDDQRSSTVLGLLQGLPSRLSEFLGINRIRELKLNHVQLSEILDRTCDVIKNLNNEDVAKCDLFATVLQAVENGIPELVITLCKGRPELLVCQSLDGKSIFQYSIECRQENVYSLIYGVGRRNLLANFKDRSLNGMLHCAGMLSPLALEKLDRIPNAALQMQRERQWYKEVESIVVTTPGESPLNKDGLTAAKLFTKNHKELHKAGEKWMKATASSYTVVGVLIITIMFAAPFTVPGGNNQETGLPILSNEKLFVIFIVSDAISLFSSATSTLMFLGIHISRYTEDDFLTSLPTKLITGIFTIFISIVAMMVAFSSVLFIMLQDKSWIISPIILFAGVPVIYFVWMHFPLLFGIFLSTHGRGISDRKVKCWIH